MIPSLLQIPSAVSDSKLHSVLPNNGKGDFTFDRSTGATRINKDGLIEEVGYFSSELVQNGNFSELGSEALTNGDFSSTSNWTITNNTGTETEIINGYVRIKTDGAYTQIRQFNVLSTGKTYKLVYDVIESDGGSLGLDTGSGTLLIPSTVGTHTFYWVSNSTTFNIKRYGGALDIKIDNVSVKQVDPNNRWFLGTGFSFGNNVVNRVSSGVGSNLYQNTGSLAGKKVKYSFTVTNRTSGRIDTSFFGASGTTVHRVEANGDYSFIIDVQAGHNGNTGFSTNSTFNGTISNVSVVEVQGDRPRLSYDITNGVVEDKPHLLLEPSSTNLVTFSEDFSQSYWFKSDTNINVNQSTSPDGNINADSIVSSTANSVHYLRHSYVAVSALTPYTYSFFIKPNGYTKFGVRDNAQTGANLTYNLETESVIHSASMTIVVNKLKDNWFKCSLTSTIGSNGVAGYALYLLDDGYGTPPNAGDPNNYSYTGDGVSGFYIYGFQLEQQSYATSYIPTAGTTITRAAETCDKTGLSSSIGQTEGVLYGEFNYNDNTTGTRRLICLTDGTTSNRITTYVDTNNRLSVYIVNGGSAQADIRATTLTNGIIKYAVLYANNNIKLFLNGTQVSTDTSATIPATSNLYIGSENGNNPSYFNWKGVALYTEPLSESQLMQLTGVTASSIYSNFVTRTASFTVEALNEVKKVIDNL